MASARSDSPTASSRAVPSARCNSARRSPTSRATPRSSVSPEGPSSATRIAVTDTNRVGVYTTLTHRIGAELRRSRVADTYRSTTPFGFRARRIEPPGTAGHHGGLSRSQRVITDSRWVRETSDRRPATQVGLQRVAERLRRRDKTRPEMASDLGLLVAGAGFEPTIFGI